MLINKKTSVLVSFAIALCASTSLSAAPGLQSSHDAVSLAISQVRQEGGACKGATLSKLKDVRDILEIPHVVYAGMLQTRMRRMVEDILDDDGDACSLASQRAISNAIESFSTANTPPRQVDTPRRAAPAPAPDTKHKQEIQNCWNYRNDHSSYDPACHLTKNGEYPMGKRAFKRIMAKLKSTNDRYEQMDIIEDKLGTRTVYMTTMQLGAVLKRLSSEVDRMETVRVAASRLVDPENGSSTLAGYFRDRRMRAEAFDEISQYF